METHDLLKDLALSATVASHLKQRNDRLSEEGKLFKGIVEEIAEEFDLQELKYYVMLSAVLKQ
ncbi:hypothetical protein NQZ68_029162 [Dissostichus eleginoides]|nr:hypothetical protein NQZ68_029162 [Dissostichus eleginoides]